MSEMHEAQQTRVPHLLKLEQAGAVLTSNPNLDKLAELLNGGNANEQELLAKLRVFHAAKQDLNNTLMRLSEEYGVPYTPI